MFSSAWFAHGAQKRTIFFDRWEKKLDVMDRPEVTLVSATDHEMVCQIKDIHSELEAIVAIHSTALGPAAGGCRLWAYKNRESAMTDALRLSQGMSYKNALADIPFGGGKAVILGPIDQKNRSQIMRAFGRSIERLGGLYVTAEDVGVTVQDMDQIALETKYVSGRSADKSGVGGDPSPYTAQGVRIGIEAVARTILERANLDGVRVAVQGLGGVGSNLCRELAHRGAHLWVNDIDREKVDQMCDLYNAHYLAADEILFANVDILAPCALGGIITKDVAKKVRAKAVAGGANNQLSDPSAGVTLHNRGVKFAPDYVINAGGIIAVAAEYDGAMSARVVQDKIAGIFERTTRFLSKSIELNSPPEHLADMEAAIKINKASRKKAHGQ